MIIITKYFIFKFPLHPLWCSYPKVMGLLWTTHTSWACKHAVPNCQTLIEEQNPAQKKGVNVPFIQLVDIPNTINKCWMILKVNIVWENCIITLV